ncbi:hypothetical protein BD410DRAFT_850420 [Rickenella mellea]|uniref:T6SS Phospholipase effector Tle1-like catalytic domain-containing protein n=1 Tax=Rickenella mellea TaxID=50990 RepID=A0A4V3AZR0_9AGAM|nr:hypothetical protein BD410DRAFT_850420 [Rickenella mellea]
MNDKPQQSCCRCTHGGRNLVVCIDGTSNQFGAKNTNVVELYSQLVKSDEQLTYYNSGIGTYAKPSWRSFKYFLQVIENKIDLAIAIHFERIVLGAYRWLVENYRENDRTFLFGFSRGAYQVRALAGMIEKANNLTPPMTIPKPLRSQTVMSEGNMKSSTDLAAHFKTTFSRKKVQIHFIGAWDTVSSVGLIREKTLPLTYSADHVCFFRHALALDERRVKFLPEYVHGIKSAPSRAYFTTQTRSPDEYTEINGDTKIGPLRIKEVWFAGTHSDMNSPFLWMTYEAASIGLRLEATQVGWKWDDIGEVRESLTSVWRIFEWIPFKRLTYKDETSTTYRLHKGHGRKIQRGQKIHASVALCPKDYEPKAKLAFDDKFKWSKIVGRGSITDIKWTIDLKDYLELDIFDYSMAKDITGRLIRSLASNTEIDPQVLFRLSVMVLSSMFSIVIQGRWDDLRAP